MRIKINLPFCEKVGAVEKANSVQFEDLTPFDNKIIDGFKSVEDLNKFRMNLYNLYKTKVRITFVKVSEEINGDVVEHQGFKLESDAIHLTDNDIGRCLPFYLVKQFFKWSKFQNRYLSNENLLFFDYI